MNISKVSAYGVNQNFTAKAKQNSGRLMSRQDSTYVYPNDETPEKRTRGDKKIKEVDPSQQKTKKVVHMMNYGDGIAVPIIYYVPVDEAEEEVAEAIEE